MTYHAEGNDVFGGNSKRGFVRTDVGATERFLSWSLLGVVICIGVWVGWKGQHFDQNVFELDPALLETVPPPREEVHLYEEWADAMPRASREASTEAASRYTDLVPEEWRQTGPVEQFTSETLYEKINGRAEQYRAFNVEGLEFVGFDDGSRFVDVFVYDMGTPAQAYGIYSVERNEGMPPVDLGREGYRVESSLFYVKGRYYVQVIASETGPDMERIAGDLAAGVAGLLEEGSDALWGTTVLPADGRIDGTMKYFVQDALNFSFLTNTYTARYEVNGKELKAFVSKQDSPEAAEAVLEGYLGFLGDYGTVVSREESDAGTLLVGDSAGYYDVVFTHGRWVGGVVETTDRQAAEAFVADWLANAELD